MMCRGGCARWRKDAPVVTSDGPALSEYRHLHMVPQVAVASRHPLSRMEQDGYSKRDRLRKARLDKVWASRL